MKVARIKFVQAYIERTTASLFNPSTISWDHFWPQKGIQWKYLDIFLFHKILLKDLFSLRTLYIWCVLERRKQYNLDQKKNGLIVNKSLKRKTMFQNTTSQQNYSTRRWGAFLRNIKQSRGKVKIHLYDLNCEVLDLMSIEMLKTHSIIINGEFFQ